METLKFSGNYHFPRPEDGDQHPLHPLQGLAEDVPLHPLQGPAEDVLSAATEEVWSATGAVEPVPHRSHQIRPVLIHHALVWSHKTGWEQTAANSKNRRKEITGALLPFLQDFRKQAGEIITDSSHLGPTSKLPDTGADSFFMPSPSCIAYQYHLLCHSCSCFLR